MPHAYSPFDISRSIHYPLAGLHRELARVFHELLSRDPEDGRATGQPQDVGPEAYLNGTSQGPTPKDARKDGHIRGRSKRFMKHPGQRFFPCPA